ncbi:hypothetical protein RD055328_00340 [Companilactobacillus sp. RD055328]|uniref:hypothetical protein n=1 Tax=Companilactobacillus sp. RD055328 TaxID=2916634 RepID=UPI001FC844BE|nr:hypothetical protein [Companilactobacillus sp. RD055328]GKQ42111.1 hypothetical protein RD055328_00340 [Companilactobacillus sp. RD055328]
MVKKISIFSAFFWKSLMEDLFNAVKSVPFLVFFSLIIAIIFPIIGFSSGDTQAKVTFILLSIMYFFGTNILMIIGADRASGSKLEDSLFNHVLYGTPTTKAKMNKFYFIIKGIAVFIKYFFSPILFIYALFAYLNLLNRILDEEELKSLDR